ncbi:MAG: hypothetical protein ACRDSZ_02420 [Pseudonocardiaceae bacterium]
MKVAQEWAEAAGLGSVGQTPQGRVDAADGQGAPSEANATDCT